MPETDKPWKAVYASILAFLSTILTAVQTVDGAEVQITVEEWLISAIAVVSAFGGVYFIDNKWGK